MKGTETFKKVIADYLQVMANTDDAFAKDFAKPNKSLEKCVNYVLNEVKKTGCNGFADEEIFGLAVHYYNEDGISEDETKPVNAECIVVNHPLTPEEIQLEKEAVERRKAERAKEAEAEMAKASKAKIEKVNKDHSQQLSLF